MKLHTLRVLTVLAAALAPACSTISVRTDADARLIRSVRCQNVAWAGQFHGASPLRNGIANPLNEGRLRDAIQADLPAVGMTLIAGATPVAADCLVGYGIGRQRVVDAAYPVGWGWGWGWGWWGPGPGYGYWGYPYVYHQGFITVDLYDAKSKRPIWHATAQTSLSGLTGADAEKKIRAAVDAIFAKFPK
ncbi:MAG TPA: DUF4136 domain-containing protein [Steroidobacteraceae bacterium]|nr:DUF4136 domain-containing protein [Steroidobacteraceae bacterium]